MWKWSILLLGSLALIACAHGGGVVFPSPTLSPSDLAISASPEPVELQTPTPFPNSARPTGEASIEPDPAILNIRSVPTEHHAVDLVSGRSAVVIASPGGAPAVVHNDGRLLAANGCAEVDLSPEGDTRLTIILPESAQETRSRFYLVGCAPGPATLTIFNEGELLNVYEFTVSAP